MAGQNGGGGEGNQKKDDAWCRIKSCTVHYTWYLVSLWSLQPMSNLTQMILPIGFLNPFIKTNEEWPQKPELIIFQLVAKQRGRGQSINFSTCRWQSTEVAFKHLTQHPFVRFTTRPKFYRRLIKPSTMMK